VNPLKKFISSVAVLALTTVGLISTTTNAQASGLPVIRMITPVTSSAAGAIDATDSNIQTYFGAGTKNYYSYMAYGQTITLKYHVTSDGMTKATGKVRLYVNSPWSGSKATWTANGMTPSPSGPSTDSDTGWGAYLDGTIDGNGDVSFTLTNTNTSLNSENVPTCLKQPAPTSNRMFTAFKPVWDGTQKLLNKSIDQSQVSDLWNVDITKPWFTNELPACPTSTATPGALPQIRMTSPVTNSGTVVDATDANIQKYFGKGSKNFYSYIKFGQDVSLTYHVTKSDGTVYPNATIRLYVNAPWSGSTGKWTANGMTPSPAGAAQNSDSGWGAKLDGTTDASGNVTFALKNTNTSNDSELAPTCSTMPARATGRVFTTFKPVIVESGTPIADTLEISDLWNADITKAWDGTLPDCSGGGGGTGTHPSIRLTSPVSSNSGTVDATRDISQYYSATTKAFYSYVERGSTVTLTYHVTTDGTTAAANKPVQLQINAPYSNSKGIWTGQGMSPSPAANSTDIATGYGALMTKTTDSSGDVSFTVSNQDTDASAEVAPSCLTAHYPSTGRYFSTFKPVLLNNGVAYDDKAEDTDIWTIDIIKKLDAPLSACSGGGGTDQCPDVHSIRLVTPTIDATDSFDASYWNGVFEYRNSATTDTVRYYPVGSKISLVYQALDSLANGCAPLANTDIYVSVNTDYSGASTSFWYIKGSRSLWIPKLLGPFDALGETRIKLHTDDTGKAYLTLFNADAVSPQAFGSGLNVGPPDCTAYPDCSNLLNSNISPSFLDRYVANKDAGEAVDSLFPYFVSGQGPKLSTDSTNVSATLGASKPITVTLRDSAGNVIANRAVTVQTTDGSVDMTSGTTDSNGQFTVNASSASAGVQLVALTAAADTNYPDGNAVSQSSITSDSRGLLGYSATVKVTWATTVVKVAQTIGAVKSPLGKGKTLVLPAKTSKNLAIKWSTSTKAICKVATVKGVTKLTGLKSGSCKVSGSNAGSANVSAVTKAVTVAIK